MDDQAEGGEVRKVALRRSALAARRQLTPEERATASGLICRRLLALPELRGAHTVLVYAPTPDEADPSGCYPALRSRHVRLLFPRVHGDRLDLVAAADIGQLELGYRGIREPQGPRVVPEVVEVALVPGVAFDPTGGRVGQGGGHYDRLLATLPDAAVRIGVCFGCQVVPRVPRADHDEPVDLIVTDQATYRAPPPADSA